MYIDERTGNVVYGRQAGRHSGGGVSSSQSAAASDHWIWKVLGIGIAMWLVFNGLNWLDDRYSFVTKVKSCFKGESELFAGNKQGSVRQTSTLVVACCKCNARIEIDAPRNGQDNIQIVCPRCAEQLIVVQNPVKVPQMIWVQGRYVDQRLPGGSIVRAWLPGHYEQRN